MVVLTPQQNVLPDDASIPKPDTPAFSTSPQSAVDALTAKPHLRRERNLLHFRNQLPVWDPSELAEVKSHLLSLLQVPNQSWEALYGALRGAALLVEQESNDDAFAQELLQSILNCISHTEARVRSATSSLIGALAKMLGLPVWQKLGDRLLSNVNANLQLDESQRLREAARVAGRDLDEKAADAKLHGLRMVHETEGWRGLETSLLALADLINGCGGQILAPAAGDRGLAEVEGLTQLFGFVIKAKDHPNRFVREAGLKLLNSAASATRSEGMSDKEEGFEVLGLIVGLCKPVILEGLQDNWSQVRFAASTVVRTVLEGLPLERRRDLYTGLLPRMCLNRHYVAEGVRNLSQDTWRSVISSDGKQYLTVHLDETITYYETQCEADNHAVREAACQGLGELCGKLERCKIQPFVGRIMSALIGCFKDESWPVRDHACRALGGVVSMFPGAAESSGKLEEVRELFEQHLADNIGSVRANCAGAYADVCKAFDLNHACFGSKRALETAMRLIEKLQAQPEQHFGCDSDGDARDRDTEYGAASKLARDNDASLHTDQTTYSCGSLAPKLRRGGGCMDHGFAREKRPWEEADGGIRLWAGIAKNGTKEAWEMEVLEQVLTAGEVGMNLAFAQDTKVKQGWLECFGDAAAVLEKGFLSDARVRRIVELVKAGRRSGNHGVETAAAACERTVRRATGLSTYAAAEKAVFRQTEE